MGEAREAVRRCAWVGEDPLMIAYHDREWGVPTHADRLLFELVTLEGAQAGLSWATILRKRENYRRAFRGFDPALVAGFDESDVEVLLQDVGIVRHRGKIESTINNARRILEVQAVAGSFAEYVWSFVGGAPILNRWRSLADLPSETPESRAMSRDMRKRGFRFLGPTTCYAFMQAAGLVNDHESRCYRHPEISGR